MRLIGKKQAEQMEPMHMLRALMSKAADYADCQTRSTDKSMTVLLRELSKRLGSPLTDEQIAEMIRNY